VISSSEEFCRTRNGHDLFEFGRVQVFYLWVINAFFRENLLGIVYFFIINVCFWGRDEIAFEQDPCE